MLPIPLSTAARVETVTLRWSDFQLSGTETGRIGRPAEFSICTRTFGTNDYVTNCLTLTSTGLVDVVTVGADTDEIGIRLNRRADGVDFYGLAEMEVSGGAVSLPVASIPGGGESRLDAQHSIVSAVDGDSGTAWASGSENQVAITLPLERDTSVCQINFQWNCQTLPDLHRLGPAASYVVFARDQATGLLFNVPFVSQGRAPSGIENATFGTDQSTNTVLTDQLVILLTVREAGVDYFSLREVTGQNAFGPVAMRLPSAMNSLAWLGNPSILRSFDGDTNTGWTSGTQGAVTAVDVRGSNLKFTALKIIGFGTKAARECFALGIFGLPLAPKNAPSFRNVLVEDCVFTDPATNNTDSLTALAVDGAGAGPLLSKLVHRCSVFGVKSQFASSKAFSAGRVENCWTDGCSVGIYFEPDPASESGDSIGTWLIQSNQFLNVDSGINLYIHPGGHFDSLVCLDNEMVLSTPVAQGWGISACDVCATGPSSLSDLEKIFSSGIVLPAPAAYKNQFGLARHRLCGLRGRFESVFALDRPFFSILSRCR